MNKAFNTILRAELVELQALVDAEMARLLQLIRPGVAETQE